MFKRTILALAVLALPVSALAQENATLTLRSGEKITGQLQDLGGVGFTVQVNGAQRQIPQNDVSVIDFGGSSMSDADWAKVPEGEQRVFLKSGEAINGQLADIGGSSPLKMTIRTSSGDREISSSEISHIVLSRPSNGVATSGSNANLASPTGNGISVSPKQAWTSTGITVKKGEVLTINASGEVQLSADANDVATPFGSKSGRKATNAPLPNVLAVRDRQRRVGSDAGRWPVVPGRERRRIRRQSGRVPRRHQACRPLVPTRARRNRRRARSSQ